VYATLDRLENKGLLRSWMGQPLGEEGGKPRRYYAVEPEGLEALEAARRALRNMWQGLEPVIGEL
jgi:DNA-binding PadR family transcriptional regulator